MHQKQASASLVVACLCRAQMLQNTPASAQQGRLRPHGEAGAFRGSILGGSAWRRVRCGDAFKIACSSAARAQTFPESRGPWPLLAGHAAAACERGTARGGAVRFIQGLRCAAVVAAAQTLGPEHTTQHNPEHTRNSSPAAAAGQAAGARASGLTSGSDGDKPMLQGTPLERQGRCIRVRFRACQLMSNACSVINREGYPERLPHGCPPAPGLTSLPGCGRSNHNMCLMQSML